MREFTVLSNILRKFIFMIVLLRDSSARYIISNAFIRISYDL